MLATNGYRTGMAKTAIQGRWDRLQAAVEDSREQANLIVEESIGVSQSEIAKRIEGIDGVNASQRTVGRFLGGDGGITIDTFTAILAALPGASDAFLRSLIDDPSPVVDQATWSRIATRLSAVLNTEQGLLLVDVLEDLQALGAVDPAWTGLRRDAQLVRTSMANQAVDDRSGKKTSPSS